MCLTGLESWKYQKRWPLGQEVGTYKELQKLSKHIEDNGRQVSHDWRRELQI